MVGQTAMRLRARAATVSSLTCPKPRSVTQELKLSVGELGEHRVGARSVNAARGHHLDDVHAPFHPFRDSTDDLAGPRNLTAHVVTVAALTRQGRPRCDDRRFDRGGRQLPVPAVKDAKSPVPQIADGRHTRHKLIAQRPGDDPLDLFGGIARYPVQG